MTLPDSLQVTALRKQIQQCNLLTSNIANLCRTIFKDGAVVKYEDGEKHSFGVVCSVIRQGVEVLIEVRPLPAKGKVVSKGKPRRVPVEDVIGVMAERED